MATNNIELITAQTAIIDEIYRTGAVTSVLEAPSEFVRYSGGKSFQIADIALTGLGNYDRQNGYPKGGVSLKWKTYEFTNDRGTSFEVDRMDNEESFGLVASRLNGEFTRDHIIPETDAYRFARIAAKAGKTVTGDITKETAIDEIDEAMVTLQENKVPMGRLLLFVTPRVQLAVNKSIDRSVANGETGINNYVGTYNNVPIIVVPQDRFYSGITQLPGTGEDQFGYTKSEDATDINFILMDRAASVNITKLNMMKYFSPDINQDKDAHKWQTRVYGESFVFDAKKGGIYVHKKGA